MRIVFAEILAYVVLLILTEGYGIAWTIFGFLGLFVISGIWKTWPISASSATLGLFVHITALLVGCMLLFMANFLSAWGGFGLILLCCLIANFLYFIGNEHWSMWWRLGMTMGTALAMSVCYYWSLRLPGMSELALIFLYPLLLWRATELGYLLVQKVRGGQS
jgi:hypothetical protein